MQPHEKSKFYVNTSQTISKELTVGQQSIIASNELIIKPEDLQQLESLVIDKTNDTTHHIEQNRASKNSLMNKSQDFSVYATNNQDLV